MFWFREYEQENQAVRTDLGLAVTKDDFLFNLPFELRISVTYMLFYGIWVTYPCPRINYFYMLYINSNSSAHQKLVIEAVILFPFIYDKLQNVLIFSPNMDICRESQKWPLGARVMNKDCLLLFNISQKIMQWVSIAFSFLCC